MSTQTDTTIDTTPITGNAALFARAALARETEREERERPIIEAVNRRATGILSGDRVGQITFIERDAIVELIDNRTNASNFKAVVGSRVSARAFPTIDGALLHLLDLRHNSPNSEAHEWAAKLLNLELYPRQ